MGINVYSISIDCTGSGTEDYRQIEVNATTAQYSIMEDGIIHCSINSLLSPSCNIDFSGGRTIRTTTFNTINEMPTDITISGTLDGNNRINCGLGSIVNSGDSYIGQGDCYYTMSQTITPSINPTISPTDNPSASPTNNPSILPSTTPTEIPTNSTSSIPSESPSSNPSLSPTTSSPAFTDGIVGLKTRKAMITKKRCENVYYLIYLYL